MAGSLRLQVGVHTSSSRAPGEGAVGPLEVKEVQLREDLESVSSCPIEEMSESWTGESEQIPAQGKAGGRGTWFPAESPLGAEWMMLVELGVCTVCPGSAGDTGENEEENV